MLSVKRFFVAGICLGAMGVAAVSDADTGHLVAAFTKGNAQPRISPDGHYIVRLSVGEGEAGMLTVSRVGPDGRTAGQAVLRPVRDVDGAVWLPHHAHALAFGACSTSGKAFLGFWDGHRLRSLHRVADPDAEMYRVLGTSPDGKILIYEQGRDSASGLVWHTHHLRLPQDLP